MVWNILLGILVILLLAGIVLVIIFDKGDSGKKLAWLLLITFLPVVGIVLYLMFGIGYRQHFIFRRRHKKAIDRFARETDAGLRSLFDAAAPLERIKEPFRPLAALLRHSVSWCNLSEGNSLEIITSGQRKLELLEQDIRAARHSIHIEYFHFGKDKGSRQIRDLLEQRAREGIEVRFLNENIANLPIPSTYYNRMRKSGIEVERFTPPSVGLLYLPMQLNYRNHRKIVVIDGRIGYTGGMNINNHYFFEWRDTHLRIEGPAVASLQNIFLDSWLTAGGDLKAPLPAYYPLPLTGGANEAGFAPEAPATDRTGVPCSRVLHGKLMQIVPDEADSPWATIQLSYEWVLQNARDYIYIQSPYFTPPESFLNALKSAALRGVDVRLMLPRKVDTPLMGAANKAYYGECLEAGVRIFERGGEFIHSKTFVCDDYLSQIGTANIDIRSFQINHEVNAYIYDRETALACKEIFAKDLEISDEIRPGTWRESRRWYQSLLSRFLRLFAGIL